jgi:RHS repeat-associated protein
MFKLRREHMEAFRPVARAQIPSRILADLQKQGIPAERDRSTGDVIITDSRGYATRLAVYPDGLPARLIQPSGATYTFEHDEQGRLAALDNPAGEHLELGRNSHGNVEKISRPGLLTYNLDHDPEGHLLAIRHPDGTSTRFSYDTEGRMVALTDRAGATNHYLRTDEGDLRGFVDPLGRETAYVLDDEGGVQAIVFPDGSRQEYVLDPATNAITLGLRDGSVVIKEMDSEDRVRALTWRDGSRIELQYDTSGKIQLARGPGGEISRTFDAAGNLLTEAGPNGQFTFFRDPDGRLVRLTTPDGESIDYEYDPDGRVSLMRDPDGRENRFSYNLEGEVSEIRYGNGLVERQEYGRLGRRLRSSLTDAQGRFITEQACEYDLSARLTGISDSWGASAADRRTRRFEYDPEGRLVAESVGDAHRITARYRYDLKGNLIDDNGTPIEIGFLDEPIQRGSAGITYDPQGNVVEVPGPQGPVRCVWGPEGLLRETRIGTRTIRYEYDALGRRILKTDGVAIWHYRWAGQQLLFEDCLSNSAAVPVRRHYLYLPGSDIPLAFRERDRCFWLLTDARGAIVGALDERGRMAWRASYDSFGNARVDISEIRQPWRLVGHYEDEETGLFYNFARYYCPWQKSYLSRDPSWYEVGVSNYSYANNDPWNRVDPYGFASRLLQGSVTHTEEPSFWSRVGEFAVDVAVIAGSVAIAAGAVALVGTLGLGAVATAAAIVAIRVVGGALLTFGGELLKQTIRGEELCFSCAANEAMESAIWDLIPGMGKLKRASKIAKTGKIGKAAKATKKIAKKKSKKLPNAKKRAWEKEKNRLSKLSAEKFRKKTETLSPAKRGSAFERWMQKNHPRADRERRQFKSDRTSSDGFDRKTNEIYDHKHYKENTRNKPFSGDVKKQMEKYRDKTNLPDGHPEKINGFNYVFSDKPGPGLAKQIQRNGGKVHYIDKAGRMIPYR